MTLDRAAFEQYVSKDFATSKAIGKTLAISPRTVEIYRAKLMRKYSARTAAELVSKLAMR